MELNQSKGSADIPAGKFADLQRATEARTAEIRTTVERTREARAKAEQRSDEIRLSTEERSAGASGGDSIQLSGAASALAGGKADATDDAERSARIEELRSAVEDGSLFDRDRLARAAERLLGAE